jgi:hypothetical protein
LGRSYPSRGQIVEALCQFYTRCGQSGLPELERLATTVQTWWPEILALLQTGITNAGSEGTNRVIKTIAHDAYGFRNPVNQRLRTERSLSPITAADHPRAACRWGGATISVRLNGEPSTDEIDHSVRTSAHAELSA